MVWKFGDAEVMIPLNIYAVVQFVTYSHLRWWTYLWMKEGFATFFEFLGIELVRFEKICFEKLKRKLPKICNTNQGVPRVANDGLFRN